MRVHHPLVCLALLGAAASAPGAARGVPVVFTASGQLGQSGAPTDAIQFNFANVRITLHADTADAPVSTPLIPGGIGAAYEPSSGLLEITDRPGGAPDLAIPYTPNLVTLNLFDPSAEPDRFELDQGSTTGVPGASQFYVGGFRVSFIDALFYPGTGPGPLPAFDVTGGAVVFGFFYDLDRVALYSLDDATLEIEVVPEPASGLLLALGLAGVGLRRARRARGPLRIGWDGRRRKPSDGAGPWAPPEENHSRRRA